MAEEPVPPSRLQSKLPRDLETICLKCLQKEPAWRYADAGDLADDLGRFLGGGPIHAQPQSALDRAVKWVKRRPGMATLLIGLALALGAGTVTSAYFAFQADQSAKLAQVALREKEAAIQQQRETAHRFVKFMKHNPDLIRLSPDQLVALFLKANTDLSPKDLENALVPIPFEPKRMPQGSEIASAFPSVRPVSACSIAGLAGTPLSPGPLLATVSLGAEIIVEPPVGLAAPNMIGN
jgi:hypothetical protein